MSKFYMPENRHISGKEENKKQSICIDLRRYMAWCRGTREALLPLVAEFIKERKRIKVAECLPMFVEPNSITARSYALRIFFIFGLGCKTKCALS